MQRVVGKTLGLKSTMTYGTLFYWGRLDMISSVAAFTKIQIQVLLCIPVAMNSTGIASIEAPIDLPSLELFVNAEAVSGIRGLKINNNITGDILDTFSNGFWYYTRIYFPRTG